MNLRLRNPFRGSLKPWPLAMRLARFGLTAAAIFFFDMSSRTLRLLVRRHARLDDPQRLPERARRIAEWLCHAATGLLFLGIVLMISGRQLGGIMAMGGGMALSALTGRYLGRTVWGLPTAFHEPTGRVCEVFRRLVQVIRDGNP